MEQSGRWSCSGCGQDNDADFSVCWQCGTSVDGTSDPNFEVEVEPTWPHRTCRRCHYMLYGLASDRCPECGEPFDREHRDTALPPEDENRVPPSRGRLWVWLGAWCAMPVVIALAGTFHEEGTVWGDVIELLYVVTLAVLIGLPIVVLVKGFSSSDHAEH